MEDSVKDQSDRIKMQIVSRSNFLAKIIHIYFSRQRRHEVIIMNRNNIKKICAWLMILAVSVSVFLPGCGQQTNESTETVYNIYFGLNDADTGEQVVTMDEASDYIRGVIESYGYGYTEHRTYGAYTENGESKGNDTLVYMLVFVEEENVKKIADQVIEHLNLASVLCQKEEMEYTFYVGEEKQQ